MIQSMTGYSSAENIEPTRAVSVEIRSYNSRHLDIALKVPRSYLSLEEKLRRLISSRLTRGRIEARINIDREVDEAIRFEIDEVRASALDKAVNRLKERYDWQVPIPLEYLIGHGGVIRPVQETEDTDAFWPSIASCVGAALDDLVAMRQTEGGHIAEDILKRLAFMAKKLNYIEAESADLVPEYQQRLKERIGVLTRGLVEIEPSRVAQEAAFLADKIDISEEIARAGSHLKQFHAIMESAEPSGRKFNFLLQELNREFNTMGSKVGNADIAHVIVSVKSEIEKVREQVQNIE